MAKGVINLQKESGGIVKISSVDGTGVTELAVPESGNLVSVNTAVTDNAIARFDGTTGKLQNSLITIADGGSITKSGDFVLYNSDLNSASPSGETVLNLSYNGTSGSKIISRKNAFNTTNLDFYVGYGYNTDKHVATLNQLGNMLIGTSVDDGISKLQVNGRISASSGIIRGIDVFYSGSDLNNLKTAGNYQGSSNTNTPFNDSGWFYIEVMSHDSSLYCMQRVTSFGVASIIAANRTFQRCFVHDGWTAWREF